ncbi:type I polyketide synthase, partial [Streptomyces sp. NPDC018584]|uniref:type I polyketide synthase n=1 Tax=unclassified Streptomyces TaxID=2593676 RepID=UPI0037A009F4
HTTNWPTTHTRKHTHTRLPTYPFQHTTHWLTPPKTPTTSPDTHPLLGTDLDLADAQGHRFSHVLLSDKPWFLEQHQLVSTPVLPASAMLEWALAGVRAAGGDGTAGHALVMEDVTFNEFLHFGAGVPVKVQASVVPEGGGYRVRCFGQPDEPLSGNRSGRNTRWAEHATVGLASFDHGSTTSHRPLDVDALRGEMRDVTTDGLYDRLRRIGVEYGPAFRGLKRVLRRGDAEALALVEVDEAEGDAGTYTLHPVVLDACFHVVAMFTEGAEVLRLPVGLDRVTVLGPLPSRVWCHARWHGIGDGGTCSMDIDLVSASGEVLVTIEGLRFRAVSAEALRAMAVTRPREYEIEWQPFSPQVTVDEPAEDGAWLVLRCDARDVAWRGRFSTSGDDAAALTVDPGSELDLDQFFGERVMHALQALSSPRLKGLVLDATDFPTNDRDGDGDSEDAEMGAVYRLAQHSFLLLKHFLRAHADARPHVVIRSAGAAHVPTAGTDEAPLLVQSVLTGVAKGVIADHPDIKCVQVDGDPAERGVPLDEALDRAARLPGAGHLAVRGGRWYVARLVERELSGGRPPVDVRSDGTYLITGGLGGLGLELAQWLARQGARSLILTGRRVPGVGGAADDGAVPPEVTALRAAGVRVELRRADVARRGDVAELFSCLRQDSARQGAAPLRGVFHLAGVTDDAVFDKLTWPRVEQVLDPKVRGAWNVYQECAAAEQQSEPGLDFFVLFSSMTSLTGAAGQASYVLANTVLDAVAAHRRGRGLPALSVGWGAWAEVGMAARDGALAALATTGVDAMEPRQAFEAFTRLGAGASGQVGLARMAWHRYAAAAARSVPYTVLDGVRPSGEPMASATATTSADALAALVEADPERARDVVLGELLGNVALLLGLGDKECDALRGTFADTRLNVLGLDSLTTVRLRSRLLSDYSADVPSDLLFGGGTASEIAGFVCRQLALRSVLAVDDDADPDDAGTEVLTL